MRAASVDEILRYCEEFFPGKPPEYFFDRNPENFPAILDMYRSVRHRRSNIKSQCLIVGHVPHVRGWLCPRSSEGPGVLVH